MALAVDKIGNVYISDNGNGRIRKVDTLGVISTIAGNGSNTYSGDGGQAIVAGLNMVAGMAFDLLGNLFIADANEHVIRKIDMLTGVITRIAGSPANSGFTGDGGLATLATLNYPTKITFDAFNNLYFCDESNQRVRKITTSGIIGTIGGNGGSGSIGDGGHPLLAEIGNPSGVAVGVTGDIYVSQMYSNKVRVMNPIALSIDENTIRNNYSVFPNPNNGTFIIQTKISDTIMIINELGQESGKIILSEENNFTETISGLSSGVYYLKGISANKKIVVIN